MGDGDWRREEAVGTKMRVIDYNGDGPWSRAEILARYRRYAAELRVAPRDLPPDEHAGGDTVWVYPVMRRVIAGIDAGDPACVRLGVELVEADPRMPFGRILKSAAARALRRASLTDEQRDRVRRRVLGMLRAGNVPHEFREYAKLARRVGLDAGEIGHVPGTSGRVVRFRSYLEAWARLGR